MRLVMIAPWGPDSSWIMYVFCVFVRGVFAAVAIVAALAVSGCVSSARNPDGFSYAGKSRPAHEISFLRDLTYVDTAGRRHSDQEIFDAWFDVIDKARKFILIDMFLYNDFQGPQPEHLRALSEQLTQALEKKKQDNPNMRIVVITDPVNVVYYGVESTQFSRLRKAGVEVVITDLAKLRDSNPSWSALWRVFIRPFGNSAGGLLPNAFGDERITLRSYLSFLNFKANHRKVLVADAGNDVAALVTSGNTHDASSAHSNIGLRMTGPAAHDVVATENAVLAMSGVKPLQVSPPRVPRDSDVSVRVLTEGKIKHDVLELLSGAGAGDRVDLAMFFLADRQVIAALKSAHRRGARLRIVLDPNRTAFGIRRIGIPNTPVAEELVGTGIAVRWCDPHGEQCHSKIMIVRNASGRAAMTLGSTNFTRRNMDEYNLETNLSVRGPVSDPVFREATEWFELTWNNAPDRRFTVPYETHADRSPLKAVLYRFMEGTGWSTF